MFIFQNKAHFVCPVFACRCWELFLGVSSSEAPQCSGAAGGVGTPGTCQQPGPCWPSPCLVGICTFGGFPGFPNTLVWFPAHVHIIISNQGAFTYVRITIYKVLNLIIPLSVSCTPQNLHNNQTSKPEPFTGRKVFPLYYFNKINYNDQLNLNLLFRFFFPVNPLK